MDDNLRFYPNGWFKPLQELQQFEGMEQIAFGHESDSLHAVADSQVL